MKVLDLFCGGGGAAKGMWDAGADFILGIDLNPQPEYPYDFVQMSVFDLDPRFLKQFDFIWASPPCQSYLGGNLKQEKVPDLVAKTRDLLLESGIPFCIENIPGAPIRKDLMLCGEMFGLKVLRHRHFEIHGYWAWQPDHIPHRGCAKDLDYVTVINWGGNNSGHNYNKLKGMEGKSRLEVRRFAMGINWMSEKYLVESVPPAYSNYIFKQFLQYGVSKVA